MTETTPTPVLPAAPIVIDDPSLLQRVAEKPRRTGKTPRECAKILLDLALEQAESGVLTIK